MAVIGEILLLEQPVRASDNPAFQESGFQPQAFQNLTGHFAFQPGAFQDAAFEEIPRGFASLAFQGDAFQILLDSAAVAAVEVERQIILTLQAVNRSSVY